MGHLFASNGKGPAKLAVERIVTDCILAFITLQVCTTETGKRPNVMMLSSLVLKSPGSVPHIFFTEESFSFSVKSGPEKCRPLHLNEAHGVT